MRGEHVRAVAAVATYNRREVLRRCIRSLLAQTRALDEIVVVDNASTDGTVEMLVSEFPDIRVVQMPDNTGAAGAFAAGLREGVARGGDWIWMFNDDDSARPEALEVMLETAAALPLRAGIVACGRSNATGEQYPLGARWNHRHVPIPRTGPTAPPLPIDVVTFSGTLVRSALVDDVGVPNTAFFMMIEDLEYCLRARRAGWEAYVLPRPLITSLTLGSEGWAPPWRGYYQTRNQLAMSLARRSPLEVWWWAVRNAKFCVGAARSGDDAVERVRLRGLGAWHALRGVSGRTIDPSTATRESTGVTSLSSRRVVDDV